MRHYVNPSNFNNQNKSYYREYFDKPFRRKTDIAHIPRRQLDPYEDNEFKGTRMPEYSKVSVERDVFGELGWIPNFNVKKSKNNDARHHNFKEFFDQPKDYNVEFTNASKTATEFFRASHMGGTANTDESISQLRTMKSRESARSPSV